VNDLERIEKGIVFLGEQKVRAMKKIGIAIGILVTLISLWWGISASQSDYHALKDSEISYATVFMNSEDPEGLALFYEKVFGSVRVKSVKEWQIEGLGSAAITLDTPGYQGDGPLLSIFKISKGKRGPLSPSDPGYAHICFEGDDMPGLVRRILANGGQILSTFEDLEKAPVVYGTDPDGNAVEVHIPLPTPLTPKTIFRSLHSFLRTKFKMAPPAEDGIRFLHVNINSTDWRRTVSFYEKALGATPTGFERNYEGEFIGNLTGIKGAVVRGQHLALPGYSVGGPTLEIFSYNQPPRVGPLMLSDKGRTATGFWVQDVGQAVQKMVRTGGTLVSERKGESALLKDIDGNHLIFVQKN
jgi:predicted enzyme related to lactoylglutathione lyase